MTRPLFTITPRPRAPASFFLKVAAAGLIMPAAMAAVYWGYAAFWNLVDRLRGRPPTFDQRDFTEGLDG